MENIGSEGNIQDVVQQLSARATIAEQLNDASIDQIIAFDHHQTIISCNKTCANKWNVEKDTIIGKTITEALPGFAENQEIRKAIRSALSGFKVFVPHESGSYNGAYYEHHFIPLKQEDDTVTAVLVVIHDVAHRIKAENELQRLNKELLAKHSELKELNKEILAFAHIAGNDLKLPLRKIYSFAEIIIQDEGASLTTRAKSYCRKIQSAAQKMGLLTDEIGSLSIIDPETFKQEEIDLNLVLQVVKSQIKNQIINKGITIEAQSLPRISGSRAHLEKLFYSIINNIIRSHTGDWPLIIRITSDVVEGKDVGHSVAYEHKRYQVLQFSGNDRIADAAIIPNMFSLCNYISNPHPQGGSSIELPMSKKICEMHDGYIIAENSQDTGVIFSCYFPIA